MDCPTYSRSILHQVASYWGLLPQPAPAHLHNSAASTCIPCIAQAENLGVILVASLFLTPTAHLSPNPVDYTSKIYLSFICFSLLPLLMSKTIIRSHLDPWSPLLSQYSPQNTHKSYILNNYMNGKMYGEGLDSKSMLNKCSLAKWMHWRSVPY